MARRLAIGSAAAAALFAGCATATPAPPAICGADAGAIEHLLVVGVPGRVRVAPGIPLSDCVARATDPGALQQVGAVLAGVADSLGLAAPHDRRAALELGYLIGATRRGASHANGTAAELVRRVERSAGGLAGGSGSAAAISAGIRAGQERG